MKLDSEFIKLPLLFDVAPLVKEVSALVKANENYVSQGSLDQPTLSLIAPEGNLSSWKDRGLMRPTPCLQQGTCLQQVMAALDTIMGRSGLLEIGGNQESPWQVGSEYYWLDRVSVHVPVVTHQNVLFHCGQQSVNMQAGECWIFDTWRKHKLANKGSSTAIHLVMDTVGSEHFWDLVEESEPFKERKKHKAKPLSPMTFDPKKTVQLLFEAVQVPLVMSPWEQTCHINRFFEEAEQSEKMDAKVLGQVRAKLQKFQRQWRSLWAQFGDNSAGGSAYQQTLQKWEKEFSRFQNQLKLANGCDGWEVLRNWVIVPGIDSERISSGQSLPAAAPSTTPALTVNVAGNGDSAPSSPALPVAVGPVKQGEAMKTSPGPSRPFANDAELASQPLRCVNTSNFPKLLSQLGISLVVSTYQAGKLILVRADGPKLNSHFRTFQMPMGVALNRRRLVVGTRFHVWEYVNQPEVGQKLEPVGKHDACFLPRHGHVTGDIRIHELGFCGPELWIVNTRFSCLCTLDAEHSFVPRWRPPFISALAPEDRCHLNGLAVVDDQPRYVTALGTTDSEGGWRENKANGGILMDVDNNEVLLSGLSMPHSPRWYQDQLWILESGEGSIARVDLQKGSWEKVAEVPGFTRGVDFYEHYAFIGLSQVRESAIFSGIPLTERLQERTCGVWIVDLRDGKTIAFLRFESGVQEIFAVQVLPNIRFPELINDDEAILSNSFVLPQEAMSEVVVKSS